MRVHSMQEELKALSGIAETSEWEATTGERSTRERPPQRLWTKRWLRAGLELCE